MLRAGVNVMFTALVAGLLHCGAPPAATSEMIPVRIENHVLNVARYEVTIADWQACVAAGACEDVAAKSKLANKMSVTGLNWFDVQNYISWHNANHAHQVRLPTAEEWRAFSREPEPQPQKPLFTDPRMAWAANYGQEETAGGPVRPQGAWSATADGVADIAGNVWEWTSTCALRSAGSCRWRLCHRPATHPCRVASGL
jgi:formylglycine-generating enzyme required for sulfatase activity